MSLHSSMGSDSLPPLVSPLQQPLASGFDRHSTAAQVLQGMDLTGRNYVVTGGGAGLGLETVRALAVAGATVWVGARRPDAARSALAGLPRVSVDALDLADTPSVDAFVRHFRATGSVLHGLINNAGIMAIPLQRDVRGHELQLSTNYLGHFRLAAKLWPELVRAGGARVVMLSSGAHRFAGVDLTDPDFLDRPYDKWAAYGQSKTAAALFALALDQRGARHGVRAYSVHPGAIETGLSGHLAQQDLVDIGALDASGEVTAEFAGLFKTVPQGAATTVWCATSSQLDGIGGVYCEDCDIAVALPAGSTSLRGVMPWAVDARTAQHWWAVSERLAGIRFDC